MPRFLILVATTTAILAGCDTGNSPPPGPAAGTTASPSTPSASTPSASTPTPAGTADQGVLVTTAGSNFGTMLFDETGQAIYLFDKETSTRPECYDACAKAWPPVLTSGSPRGAGEASLALLGTTARTDGTTQVTYAGHPLYYYAHEGKNQVLCHNVEGFGGLWLVITPSGKPAP